MHKITICILVIFNMIYSIDNNKKNKVGIGLEWGIVSAILSSEGAASLYFPMQINKTNINTGITEGYMIEPEFFYNKSSRNIYYPMDSSLNYTEEEKTVGAILGIYKLSKNQKMNKYYGIKLGYAVGTETPNYANMYNLTGLIESNSIFISPAMGSEYFISDNFSIGGEISVQYSQNEKEYPRESSLSGKAYTETTTATIIRPKFMVRFYF